MRSAFLDKLIGRLDRIDPGSLQGHFLQLAREKGVLETIFHALHEGVAVVDDTGRIQYANRSAGRLFGFHPDAAAGQPLEKYLRDIDWARISHLDGAEWSRMVTREIEVSYPEHRFVTFYVVPLRAVDPAATGAVVIFRDVTGERRREATSLESERLQAIMLLAGGVAHEIGNPLNSLNIHLQLLRRQLASLPEDAREPLRELVSVANQEVRRLDGIIKQFLQAVRPTPLRPESVHLGELARAALDFLRPELDDRKILVEFECPDALPAVRADRDQMKQAFYNIIRNAAQAMADGGALRVTLSAGDRFVAISFRDQGGGIAPEHLSHIFEPYYTTKRGGTGLGLMIVQRILRDHGGEIEINTEPGRGATCTLFVPREDRVVRLLNSPPREPAAGAHAP